MGLDWWMLFSIYIYTLAVVATVKCIDTFNEHARYWGRAKRLTVVIFVFLWPITLLLYFVTLFFVRPKDRTT